MNPSLAFLKKYSDLPDASFKKLEELAEYRKVPSKSVIIEAGETPKTIYLLISGVLRAYVTTEKGKEFNKRLYSPISFAGAFTSIVKNEPSKITYECITECKFFEVNFEKFRALCREDFNIGKLYVKILEQAFILYEERSIDLMTLDSTQQYLKIRKQIPNIDELIPQYQIASYLGITAVQLSRIRKKLIESVY